MGTCPGVLVDARQVRESRPSRSVEAARTASAVRGDQDHENRDHYQRQTYSQPRPPVPLGPSVVPPRLVHLEPPLRASSSSRGCTHGTTSVVTASHHLSSRQARPTQEAGAEEGHLFGLSSRSAFLSCSYPRPRGHRSTLFGGGSRLADADLVEVATEVGRVVVDPVRARPFEFLEPVPA
jgi:hypothetical protein